MPLVRRPNNASFIAGARADLPFLLPFLAPSLSTEPSAGTRGAQHHVKSPKTTHGRVVEKGEGSHVSLKGRNRNADLQPITTTSIHDGHGHAEDGRWRQARGAASASGLAQHPPRQTAPNSSWSPSSVCQLYADIFAIARQQRRSYASVGAWNPDGSGPQSPYSTYNPPVNEAKEEHIAHERSAALAIEKERLRVFLARYGQLQEKQLMKNGQYRSLLRRILNFEEWHMQELHVSTELHRGDWLIRTFAALDRCTFVHMRQHTRRTKIIHNPECTTWCSKLLEGLDEEGQSRMWKNWVKIERPLQESIWRPLLIYLLDCKPSRALDFMEVLCQDKRIKKNLDVAVLADALGHLSSLHRNGQYDTDPDWNPDFVINELEFVPGFYRIFICMFTERTYMLPQDLIYSLSQFAETEDLKEIFDLLIECKFHFSFDTLLHCANVFAEAGEVDYALRCLEKLSEGWRGEGAWDEVVNRQRLRWTCALILRNSASQESGYRATPGLVETFVRMGVKMDLTLYNVVIHNAMEAGDYATAFKLYNSLEEHKLNPDTHTLGILLHGCILQDNPAMFGDFARHCENVARETQNAWLASEYLYYCYVRLQDNADVEESTTDLWLAYLKLFQASGLESLVSLRRHRLRDEIASSTLEAGIPLIDPSPMAVYILLQAEIKYAMSLGDQPVQILYDQFKVLVLLGQHPKLSELAKQPIIWNAFLLAFCRKLQFASASQVIKDMMDNSPQPNIYSWNIFMQAFFKSGQVQAAERVFEIMRSRGVDPDQYTHGVMLRGYAKAQLVDQIGETMQHVDAEHEMDPHLLQTLSRMVDREKLMRVLEESRMAKLARLQEQAKKEAAERAKRWAVPEFIDPEDEVAELRKLEAETQTGVDDEDEDVIQKAEEQVKELQGRFVPPVKPKERRRRRRRKTSLESGNGEEYF
ncbi:hypothetical protein IAQ61_000016 [Plenodomus lingam]|uniref:Pentatricopeptide repeat protein n=1 Tax=Leptosphaeria maculans (strain JN3 / isolate v23.1.3 / race Av1-4-5-6-7-8) TaxID=985895 RepID=E5R421_LEPMJ|nr:hypothetical protein LEMA_P045040.1 [Plenodomus lingam JN3]KAH9881294.1 hypothetical protein IAQ61_000016 [Plenodomus lingam]CBX91798.1 hypothetical protein LEMA_P045040.1 [Plenodomus lingam JN3]